MNSTSLERQLELLEARFTMPPQSVTVPLTAQGAPTPSPSEATLGSLSSPTVGIRHGHSQHSFSFDTPSASASSHRAASPLPSAAIRAKAASPTNAAVRLTSLERLQRATERHLAKVRAQSPVAGDSQGSHCTVPTSHYSQTRRTRLPDTANTATTTATTTVAPDPTSPTRSRPLPEVSKRKSVPVKRQQPSVRDPTTTTTSGGGPLSERPSPTNARKRSRTASTPHDTASRDRSTPSRKPTAHGSLYDFFKLATSTKPANDGNNPTTVPNNYNTNNRHGATVTTTATRAPAGKVMPLSPSKTLESLRCQIQELERAVRDKDDQLRAVSNNRTLLQGSLQNALTQCRNELSKLRTAKTEHEEASRLVLEGLVRKQAQHAATALRAQLAADGARLGRIVTTHTALRLTEKWEDGYAIRELAARRTALADTHVTLQARADAAEAAAAAPDQSSPLAVAEALESVRWHRQTARQAEATLAADERALRDAQAAHVRALKRVASEDDSKFVGRPKLHDRYVLESLLGKGGFSEVWQAYDLVALRPVAVKIHQLDSRWSAAKKDNFTKHVAREYRIHRNVRHPRIVSLFDVFEIDNDAIATVLEVCDGADLDALLKLQRRLPERDARAILLQILSGMMYLSHPSEDGSHQGIIHYDLKPANILFDQNGDAKITDFGLSKIIDSLDETEASMELTSQGAGTYWYLPPECFVTDENVRISNRVDVWSIGVIFYQMLFGKRPFGDGQSQDRILTDNTMLNAHSVEFPDQPVVSSQSKDFIRACLTYDQSSRPTIAELCQKPYVVSRTF
jgi:tousled-like kinase